MTIPSLFLSTTVADPLLTATDVAAMLGITRKRAYELPIPYVQISRRSKRWKRSDVEAFIASRRQEAA